MLHMYYLAQYEDSNCDMNESNSISANCASVHTPTGQTQAAHFQGR